MALKKPSQTKLFGLGVPKAGRRTQQFKAMAFKVTLKTPSGDEEIECDGDILCARLLCCALASARIKTFGRSIAVLSSLELNSMRRTSA